MVSEVNFDLGLNGILGLIAGVMKSHFLHLLNAQLTSQMDSATYRDIRLIPTEFFILHLPLKMLSTDQQVKFYEKILVPIFPVIGGLFSYKGYRVRRRS